MKYIHLFRGRLMEVGDFMRWGTGPGWGNHISLKPGPIPVLLRDSGMEMVWELGTVGRVVKFSFTNWGKNSRQKNGLKSPQVIQ